MIVDALTTCVKTKGGTRYLEITETVDTSETAEITFTDLVAGDTVDVFGGDDAMEPACVLADAVPAGHPVGRYVRLRRWKMNERPERVCQ